ncbi:transposase [Streptococcus pneumoniae]|nr:transposase [Streptococcus pneumoniae]
MKIGLTTTLKNAWTTSRQVNFFWVANFNLKFGLCLYAKGIRYKYKYYSRRHSSLTRPNLINQCFQTKGKNEIWLGDLTYIPTKAGTLYLSLYICL